MENKIIVIGAAGSMGTRYRAILNYLKIPFFSIDIREYTAFKYETILTYGASLLSSGIKSAIICTRTNMHSVAIDELQEDGIHNFLIEKPMFNKPEDYEWAKQQKYSEMRMVCNYKFIDGTSGDTYYSYYHSGSEEPWSNLLQIIGIARSELKIESTSPIWKCSINGRDLTLEDVHKSYILMIEQWIKDPSKLVGIEEAEKWFRKAKRWQESLSPCKLESPPVVYPIKSFTSLSQDSPFSTPVLNSAIASSHF